MIDCEHFFDGWKGNRDYALAVATTAHKAGARWVVLCDTNGGTLPHEIAEIVADVVAHVPGAHLGIHTHNDTENAVANTLAAVRAGARQIQGALNGLGERCGNANLTSLIPTLVLKPEFARALRDAGDAGAPEEIDPRQPAARRAPEPRPQPPGALRRRGGVRHQGRHPRHAPSSRSPPPTSMSQPETVGNRRRVLVSDQAGKSNLIHELERLGIPLSRDDRRISTLLEEVKAREAVGYAYEGADASFELLARRLMGEVPDYFRIRSFRVEVGSADTTPPAGSSRCRKPP